MANAKKFARVMIYVCIPAIVGMFGLLRLGIYAVDMGWIPN